MTMYIKRPGFIVWVLVLLATSFVLSLATPLPHIKKSPRAGSSRPESAQPQKIPADINQKHTNDENAEMPPTELSTSQAASTEDKGEDETTDHEGITETIAPPEGPSKYVSNGGEDSAAIKDEEFLYFEIRKCISKRNLSHSDIQEVLSQKDDKQQFMFILADKLGYLVDGKHDNPHISVIKSHMEKLIALLEMKKTPSSQEIFEQEPAESDATPVSGEPAADSNMHRVGYKVSKEIQLLGAEAIDSLINDYSLSGVLGYAVGKELGYSDNDERMEYLEDVKENELKDLLRHTLKLKMSKDNLSTSDDREDRGWKTSGGRGLERTGTTSQGGEQDGEKTNNFGPSRPEEREGPGPKKIKNPVEGTGVELVDEKDGSNTYGPSRPGERGGLGNDLQGLTHHDSDPMDTEVPTGPKKTENPVEGVWVELVIESWELETPRQKISDETKAEDRAEPDNDDSHKEMYYPDHAADDNWKLPSYHQYPSGVGLRDYIILCLLVGISVGVGYLCSCANRKVAPVRIVMIKPPDMMSKFNGMAAI